MAYAPPRPNTRTRETHASCNFRSSGCFCSHKCPSCDARMVTRVANAEAMRHAKVTRFSASRPS